MIFIKNRYEIDGDTLIIFLNNQGGKYKTYIDLSDKEKVDKINHTFFASWRENTKSYYAVATVYLGMIDGKPKYKTTYLHKLV
jgi:hypothetical protein